MKDPRIFGLMAEFDNVNDAIIAARRTYAAGYRKMDFTQMMAGVEGMMAGMMGAHHGAGTPGFPSALPPGFTLPPGMALPSGLPPGVTLPKNTAEMMKQLEERAKAAGLPPPH